MVLVGVMRTRKLRLFASGTKISFERVLQRKRFDRRAFACVRVRTSIRHARPARAVVMPGIVCTKAFAQSCAACVTVMAQPLIPSTATAVCAFKKLVVPRLSRQLPCRRAEGHDHLDLSKAYGMLPQPAGKLAIIALLREECEMVVAGHVGSEKGIDESFLRRAFLPDAAVGCYPRLEPGRGRC